MTGKFGPSGRGTDLSPANRFETVHEVAEDEDEPRPLPGTQVIEDTSRSIVSENTSPDIPYRFSINPYRGCEHGCPYCYARPYHEYLGYNAGIDFESKIVVKPNAAALFRDWLARPDWSPDAVHFSGVTDCYQPLERRLRLTRGCLEVAAEARQPVAILTKNALVARDLDLLAPLARIGCARVALSITTLDAGLARTLEPRASTPEARLRTISELSQAGVPVRVMVAPIIVGLTDSEVPAILAAAAKAGATSASNTILRLPGAVGPIFLDWLRRVRPNEAGKVEAQLRTSRGGNLDEARFGLRHRAGGQRVEQIHSTFRLFTRKLGLDGPMPDFDFGHFRPPAGRGGQRYLF